MTRTQWITIVVGILLVLGIYQLPRVVVENDRSANLQAHSFEMSDADAQTISSLKVQLDNVDHEKNLNFADSLARLYFKYGLIDSARNIADRMLARESSLKARKWGVNVLFTAFERSPNGAEAAEYAKRLRPLIEEILLEEPQNLKYKNKLAMTLVNTETPMAGITLLREIVSEDPENREALINLGLLSIQSNQLERAVARFENLLTLDSLDYESMLYLAVSKLEQGDKEQAEKLLVKIATADGVDPAILRSAEEYLERN